MAKVFNPKTGQYLTIENCQQCGSDEFHLEGEGTFLVYCGYGHVNGVYIISGKELVPVVSRSNTALILKAWERVKKDHKVLKNIDGN